MITIGKPYIEQIDNKIYLKSHVVDEGQHIDEDMYFVSDLEYGQYLCDEVADAFLVAMLQPAIKYGQDIVVKASVSERLLYNITNSLIYAIGLSWGNVVDNKGEKRSNIKVIAEEGCACLDFNSHAVGCGCSLGVDSFAAMLQHLSPDCPPHFRISHLTYFNVGAMGYKDLEKAHKSYLKDLAMVKEFAKEQNLPVVCIESNISLWHQDFNFDESGHIRNYSTILSMQKLFRRYLYGSSFPLKDFQFFSGDSMGYWESLAMSLMSTENTELIVANPDMSRVDKTKSIVNNPLTKKYLYVCWKEITANRFPNGRIAAIKDNYLNCTRCDKCLRTLLAIDLLGKLDDYYSIFDIDYYKKEKDSYIAKVLLNKEKSTFYVELQDLMKEVGYQPSKTVKKELYKLEHPKIVRVYSILCRLFRR